jgi:hypothetical protein
MAETQRAPRPSAPPLRQRPAPKPRPRHPYRYATPLQIPLDETQDLRPPEPAVEPEAGQEKPQEPAARERPTLEGRERRAPSPRTPAEQVLMTVLVLGLGLTAAVLLLDSALTRADVLLGSTVLLAGVILLTFLEICRRGGPARRS